MRLRNALILAASTILVIGTALAVDQPPKAWREYPGQDNIEVPPDYQEKTEWQFARLMYPPFQGAIDGRGGFGGFRRFGYGNWKQGRSSWTTDYSAADRHLSQALRRLTRVHIRSVEQPVDLDDGDDVFNYPWLYAVEVGHWQLTDSQAKQFREFLDRGGFFMCDDFHGTQEWAVFTASLQKVFPEKLIANCAFNSPQCDIVDLPSKESIFHTVYDLDTKYQVPGAQYLRSGRTSEKDGYNPHWRGVYDAHGRVVVAICNDMDLGDSWEWADEPAYDEKFSAMGFRIAANYLIYSMTH